MVIIKTFSTSGLCINSVSTHNDHSTKKRNRTYVRFSKPLQEIGDAIVRKIHLASEKNAMIIDSINARMSRSIKFDRNNVRFLEILISIGTRPINAFCPFAEIDRSEAENLLIQEFI